MRETLITILLLMFGHIPSVAPEPDASAASAPAVCRSDADASATSVNRATIAQAAWLTGTWISNDGTTTVEERWTPASSGVMFSVGRTLRGDELREFEFVCIAERGGRLVYTAMPNAKTPATDFMLTSITVDSMTFENPAHDFPKLVRYTHLPDGRLQTMVSAGGKTTGPTVVLTKQ